MGNPLTYRFIYILGQKKDFKRHKLDCKQLKQVRSDAKKAGIKKHSAVFKFEDYVEGEIHEMQIASGAGRTIIYRSPQPDIRPHIMKFTDVDFKMLSEVRFKSTGELINHGVAAAYGKSIDVKKGEIYYLSK